MPPKVKLTKNEILSTAVDLVREGGADALNARALAQKISCSTQPIFSNFAGMEELRLAVMQCAYDMYLDFIERETVSGEYPEYKASGMGYIRFAKDEPELFKLIFMNDRNGDNIDKYDSYTEEKVLPLVAESIGISIDEARVFHLEMWAFCHGIAVMFATSYYSMEWNLVSRFISDMYNGLRLVYKEKERNQTK